MAEKAFVFVTCAFGVFLLTQSAAITRDEETEYKPDIRYLQVEVDDKEFNLTLVQRLHQVFHERTPVWTIESGDKITELEYSKDKRQINGLFYGDSELMATLLASYDKDVREAYYNGLISIGTKIYNVESAVDEWWREPEVSETTEEEVPSSKSDEQQSAETSEPQESNEQKSEETVEEPNSLLRSLYENDNEDSVSSENTLKTLYPKILAVVDYDLYNQMGQSVEKVIEYVATFWNAVDLTYSKLISPKVKIIVKGVVIVKDEDVSLISADLKSFNENFVKETGFVNYDAAFVLSKASIKTKIAGADLGSICNRQTSISLVQDDANYKGLLIATHELGHLLNLPHDGLGRAGSCAVDSENNVTFMTAGAESEKQLSWSPCSRDILQEFSKSKSASCLKNYWRHE